MWLLTKAKLWPQIGGERGSGVKGATDEGEKGEEREEDKYYLFVSYFVAAPRMDPNGQQR